MAHSFEGFQYSSREPAHHLIETLHSSTGKGDQLHQYVSVSAYLSVCLCPPPAPPPPTPVSLCHQSGEHLSLGVIRYLLSVKLEFK